MARRYWRDDDRREDRRYRRYDRREDRDERSSLSELREKQARIQERMARLGRMLYGPGTNPGQVHSPQYGAYPGFGGMYPTGNYGRGGSGGYPYGRPAYEAPYGRPARPGYVAPHYGPVRGGVAYVPLSPEVRNRMEGIRGRAPREEFRRDRDRDRDRDRRRRGRDWDDRGRYDRGDRRAELRYGYQYDRYGRYGIESLTAGVAGSVPPPQENPLQWSAGAFLNTPGQEAPGQTVITAAPPGSGPGGAGNAYQAGQPAWPGGGVINTELATAS